MSLKVPGCLFWISVADWESWLSICAKERQSFPRKAIDYDHRQIKEASSAARNYSSLSFNHKDVRDGIPEFCGNIALLVTLQFFSSEGQRSLLRTAALSVTRGGKLIIRSGIKDNSLRFKTTRLGDRFARATLRMKAAPTCYPDTISIINIMEKSGLKGTTQPLWGKTPFNN